MVKGYPEEVSFILIELVGRVKGEVGGVIRILEAREFPEVV